MINRIIRAAVILSVLGLASSSAQCQDKTSADANRASSAKSSATDQVVRIELEKSPIRDDLSLTLNRAVELGLERSPILVVEKIRLEQAREKIGEEKGFYDPLLNFRGLIDRRDNVVASTFYPTGVYVEADQGASTSIELKTYTGSRFTLGLDYKRLVSSSNTQTLSPQYSGNFVFSFTQALLRDFGWDVNTTRIRVAEKGANIAEQTLAQRVSQLIQQIEEGYWGLYYLRQDLDAKRHSLEIAQGLLKRNEELFRAGRVAQVSVLEARAGVAAREEGVISAESDVKKFEDRLKLLLHVDLDRVNVTPIDRPAPDVVIFDSAKSLQLALKQRPEIQGLQKELEQREIELKFAANQTLPRLDFTAQYGMNGLAGRPNQTCQNPTSIFCVPVGDGVDKTVFAGQTHAKDAFDRMFSHNPFDNWSVELKLQIPLGNRTANAQYSEANLRLAETSTRLRALKDQVQSEIRDAIRDTQTARKRIEASREAVKFVDEQLDGTRRKFDAGLASSYEVLQVLDDLDKAMSAERRALMDYNVGQGKVRLAEGSVLEKYNIELSKPPHYIFDRPN